MIDTTEHEPEDGLQAFLRYVPRRIAAFEKRILRYRFEGWDPRGMAVLGGDVRRLADASGRYGLADTHHHLMALAQMVGDHLANMWALDPQHAQRMFAALSAVMKSLPAPQPLAPHAGLAETAATIETTDAASPSVAGKEETLATTSNGAAEPEAAPVAVDEISASVPEEAVDAAAGSSPEPTSADATAGAPAEIFAPMAFTVLECSEPTAVVFDEEPAEAAADETSSEASADVAEVEAMLPPETVAEEDAVAEPAESDAIAVEESTPAQASEAVPEERAQDIPPAPEPRVRTRLIDTDEADESEAPAEPGVRRIYHLNDGSALALELGQALEAEGYAIEPVETLEELSEFLLCLMPQLLLVDASHLPELQDIAALRREAQLRSQPPRRIQMAVMAPNDHLETRRAAHRAGADLLLSPPFDIAEIQARLRELYSSVTHEKVRVLIVEDDRVDALFAQAVLAKAGMQAHVEHDPLQVLDALKTVRPDLVLMDLHMPYANGVEVTMLIREHPQFARVPIVFLSGESDPDSRLEAINAGGDDFLFKPIRPRNLVAAVQDRVRRMHRAERPSSGSDEPGEAAGGM